MNAIEVRNLGKRFYLRTQEGGVRSLKAAALEWLRGNKSGGRRELWALKEVSFEVKQGEVLGIIGANGAGKSTLLAILAQTMRPTEGTIDVKGRVSSLLELGAGFHPDLTGRENIYLNGSILGLSRREIADRYEKIVEFSELGEFMDTPVKHYSSGMYVRLGFAVAVEVDPDILLVDEVLAVGDEKFRKRCLAKFQEFQKQKKTMLVISHDLDVIKKISDRVLLLDGGRVRDLDIPGRTVDNYRSLVFVKEGAVEVKEVGTKQIELKKVRFLNAAGKPADEFQTGDAVTVEIDYLAHEKISDPVFGFSISEINGKVCFGTNTSIENTPIASVQGGGRVVLKIARLNLLQEKYYFSFAAHSRDHKTQYHRLENKFSIFVKSQTKAEGTVHLDCRWEVPATPSLKKEIIGGNV